jgi:hypothetical protein
MQRYKNHPIDAVAVVGDGQLWRSRGVVFDSERPTQQIKRLEWGNVLFVTREDAEDYALTLCKAWVDGLKPDLKKTH